MSRETIKEKKEKERKDLFLQRRNMGAGRVEGFSECILVVVILKVINGECEILITQLTNLVIMS